MNKPLRFIDDPATAAGLRQALEAERLAAAARETTGLKAAILDSVGASAKLASGAAATKGAALAGGKALSTAATVKLIGAGIAGVIAVGAVGYGLLREPATSPSPPAPEQLPASVAPAPEQLAPSVERPAVVPELPAPLELEAWELDKAARSPRQPADTRLAPRPRTKPAAASTLSAQLALYEEAQARLRDGDLKGAIAGYQAYLKRFPDGQLRLEASLSLLEGRLKAKQHARAEALARRLLADPGFAARRGELLRVRGECLAMLGRCAEAERVFDLALKAAGSRIDRSTAAAALADCAGRAGTDQ